MSVGYRMHKKVKWLVILKIKWLSIIICVKKITKYNNCGEKRKRNNKKVTGKKELTWILKLV